MKPDFTEQQSLYGLRQSEQLSLQNAVPPAEIPGYQVDQLLGQGAFGQVWLARDLNTGRQVAIKFYLCGGVDWSQLGREVKHLVSMSTGRHIVQVLAVGWEAEPPYYVMEYLENGSLEDQLRARGALGVSETVSLLREIADGLSYAHSKGVLHCDLKPANVLLDHALRPRLADFGQSRLSDETTPSLGTLFFMAPEQADLKATPDAAWDVYALGAIAYTMLVGTPPYRTTGSVQQMDTASNLSDRLQRYQETIRNSPPARLHYRRRGVDKALCQIVDRCIAANPAARFGNVQQVIAAIDSRNRTRSLRPLWIMAVAGPICLLVLMLVFSARSISVAKRESLEKVQQLSLRGNQQTAKFAKLTMEAEIRSLFELMESESQRTELQSLLREAAEATQPLLASLATTLPPTNARQEFLDNEVRQKLDAYLQTRIAAIIDKQGVGNGVAIFNSLFVNEAGGTQIGLAFSNPEEDFAETPLGKNYAYRSYFNGMREDGNRSAARGTYLPTRHTHLSASFRSTATGEWKMGISAPIWPEGHPSTTPDRKLDPNWRDMRIPESVAAEGTDVEPIGVLVLTVNLGDFVLLSDVASGDTQFTTLVDGRPGNQQGTLLQHPLIRGMDRATMLNSSMPQINQKQLERLQSLPGIIDYRDPAVNFAGGEKFEGTWIAAMSQVGLPRTANSERGLPTDVLPTPDEILNTQPKSDLWVLVQERASTVAAPITDLGNLLQRESLFALAALSLMIVALWLFALRIGNWMFGAKLNDPSLVPFNRLSQNASISAVEPTLESDR